MNLSDFLNSINYDKKPLLDVEEKDAKLYSGMVIALLASALGEERLKPLTQSEYWQAYMVGRRSLVEVKDEVDQLTRMIERMRGRDS